MSKIFINYRRKDSAPHAGRLYDRLAGRFGDDHVFMDIDQIEPGEVFDQVIQEKLAAVQVAVVLIGEHWLDIADANGKRRLDHPDDWVRLEISALLERNIRVIPVLVGGATMPKSTQLPECLAPLTGRQAIEITDHRFHADADKLIKALEKIMGVQTPPPPPKIPFAAILGVLVTLLAAFGLFHYSPLITQQTGTQLSQPVAPEPEKLVAKQSTVELPSETSASSIKSLVIAEQSTEIKPPVKKKPVVEQPTEEKPLLIEQPAVKQPSEPKFPFEPEMVRIPPGKFLMGSADYDDEKPQHEVTIAYAFEISKYEVTFDEYDAFANATKRQLPSDSGWGRGKRPVINVSFNDAQAYVQWLSNKTGKQYRLPSEAEWEYSARAGTQTAYWWGNDIGRNNAVCMDCGSQWDNKQTAPVGSFNLNAFGLYDTAGNVWEWTQDCWHGNYQNAPKDGSAWRDISGGDCSRRVVRGGSWGNYPQNLRSARRSRDGTGAADVILGFRIARDF
ncbi:SUMF1/EgtB/PvdO family nonheme iron enzyme [Nitrosomonas sp.]|uniref:SUMF1/EgtB/PvdO family nonheme iron enzyme n=1 Tax=Nitrosomonas sp. TaxID=42353 RepID=UPI00374D445A